MAVARLIAKYSGREISGNFDSDFFTKYTTIDHYISRGGSGNVYGPIQWNDTQLAIKQALFADGKVTDEFKKDIAAKKDTWMSLEHKHLIKIHSVDLNQLPKAMYIVMEFAGGGSLHKTLQSLGTENKLPIDVVRNWAKQIAEGMVFLHQNNIVHRDLKSSNILLMESFNDRDPYAMMTLKIADFDDIKEHYHTTTVSIVGTFAYMAPEVLQHQRFSKASDVWSYGVVLWEMLSGDSPHKGLEPTTIMFKSINGKLDNLPLGQSFPADHQLLLRKCWKSAYGERPSFQDIFCSIKCKEICNSYPVLNETITKESSTEVIKTFIGMTILDKELFVATYGSSEVEVYDSLKFSFSRRWTLEELINPRDIVSCSRNKCLYISHSIITNNVILRLDRNGNLTRKWSTGHDWGFCLSVTDESNIILPCFYKSKLNEYSPDGQLIREINLSDADIICPHHAIKLTNGHFLVCHHPLGDAVNNICVVNADGKLIKSFKGMLGTDAEIIKCPVYLSVDGNGSVMVADKLNCRVLLLDSDLNFCKEILSKEKHKLNVLEKILVDEANGQMLVADNELWKNGRILVFQFRL